MEGTSFFEVYKRAITEFKDPTLKALLESGNTEKAFELV